MPPVKKIWLIGNAFEEKLLAEQFTKGTFASGSKIISQYSLPGGILLLENFLVSIAPGDEIIVNSDQLSYSMERISETTHTDKPGTQSVYIKKVLGTLVSREAIAKTDVSQNPPLGGRGAKREIGRGAYHETDILLIDDSYSPISTDQNWLDKPGLAINSFILYKLGKTGPDNKLLKQLTSSFGDKLIVIIDADGLRNEGLKISNQLSWDKTLEDTRNEYHHHPVFRTLKNANTLVIRFGLEAVLCIFKATNSENGKESTGPSCRFFYSPSKYEGETKEKVEGEIHGSTEAFEAAFAKKILHAEESMLNERELISSGIMAGMHAAINCLQSGYSIDEEQRMISYPVPEIFKESGTPISVADLTRAMNSEARISLLGQHTFQSTELIHYLAFLFVKEGKSSSFDMFPYAEYNDIKTYDRDEMEGFRGLKARISKYLSGNDNKPVSIGVFGPPGSGKSFGVKQIAKFFKDKIVVREANLSQYQDYTDLVNDFRAVADINLKGKVPLVFFDEFDCDFEGKPLGWLKYFIAPMQDGEYKWGEGIHPLGKAIFVFAGGNFATYEQFKALVSDETYRREFGNNNPYLSSLSAQQIKSAKVDDFDGRIKWHLNIKGIDKKDNGDTLYSLRRSMVLRNLLSGYPGIKEPSGRLIIDNDLLYALIEIPALKHGARSLETITRACGLESKKGFHKAWLPSTDQLERDVDTLQLEKLMKTQNILPPELIEPMAEEIHKRWLANEKTRGSEKQTMKSWSELPVHIQDSNRQQAIDMIRKLHALGYQVISMNNGETGIDQFTAAEVEEMAKMEQERWMTEKIAKGWHYGKTRDDQKKIHDCLLPWNNLDEKTKDLDRNTVALIPDLLKNTGFAVKKPD